MSDEILPDIPSLLSALEESLSEFDEELDWTKVTKKQLMTNIYNLYDALRLLTQFTLAKTYKIDILDRAMAHHITKEEDPDIEDDFPMPSNVPKELYM